MASNVVPEHPLVADYSAKAFRGVSVPMFLLARANMESGVGMLIQDRTFHGCTIEGPAVLMPVEGCTFDACNFGYAGGDIRNVILRPEGERVTGVIALARCRFVNCFFLAIGFTGQDSFLQSLRNATGGGLAT
jgi:hypothetical protein